MEIQGKDRRGLSEILGLSFSAFVVGGVVIVQVLHGQTPESGLMGALLAIIGVTVARSSQGAAERSGSSEAFNAAATELKHAAAIIKAPIITSIQTPTVDTDLTQVSIRPPEMHPPEHLEAMISTADLKDKK